MRDLASVVTIEKVWPLEGKDRVVGASFIENGYEVMVGKDTQPGMLVAFIQEGSILPVKEQWEFLRKRCYKEAVNGFVIKPQKFGCIKSWGLAVPLSELGLSEKEVAKLKAGDDITELLEIRKYEPEEDASPKKGEGKKAYPKWVKFCLSHVMFRWIGRIWQKKHQNHSGGFPTEIISKSDESTLQNYKVALEKFKDDEVYATCKIEGQSFTALHEWNGKKVGKFYVCSRNNAYKCPDNSVFWTVARNMGIDEKIRKYYAKTGMLLVLQGEQVGPGIQENIYDFNVNKWFIYTIKDQITGRQLSLEEMNKVCFELGIDMVPFIQKAKLSEIMPDINTAVSYAEARFWKPNKDGTIIFNYEPRAGEKLWKDYFQHEGVVIRSTSYDKDRNIGVSFKVKNLPYSEYGLGKIHSACVALKRA